MSKNTKELTVISSKILLTNSRFNVIKDEVVNQVGKRLSFTYLKKQNAVGIIVEIDDKIVFVEQYRHIVGKRLLELPGGRIEIGESPEEAAKRELHEEVGIIAGDVRELIVIYPLPSVTNEKIYIYIADSVLKDQPNRDTAELGMKYSYIHKDEVISLLKSGLIPSSVDALALYTYFHRLKGICCFK